MSENRILDMLGDIRAKMFEILCEPELSQVLAVIDNKMSLYRGISDEDIANAILKEASDA